MVAIHFEKSCWALVSMLAILKAGGAVVPLNVQHPMERILVILDDARVKLLLTSHRYKNHYRDTTLNVLLVDHDYLQSLPSRPSKPSSAVQPHNAAFVIYTSGSTGKPKGVILDHAALCTAMQAHGTTYGMSTQSRVVQFSNYNFDVSIGDVFIPLFLEDASASFQNKIEQTI